MKCWPASRPTCWWSAIRTAPLLMRHGKTRIRGMRDRSASPLDGDRRAAYAVWDDGRIRLWLGGIRPEGRPGRFGPASFATNDCQRTISDIAAGHCLCDAPRTSNSTVTLFAGFFPIPQSARLCLLSRCHAWAWFGQGAGGPRWDHPLNQPDVREQRKYPFPSETKDTTMNQETLSTQEAPPSQDLSSSHWPGYLCNSGTDHAPCLICGRTGRSRGAIIFANRKNLLCQECIQQILRVCWM